MEFNNDGCEENKNVVKHFELLGEDYTIELHEFKNLEDSYIITLNILGEFKIGDKDSIGEVSELEISGDRAGVIIVEKDEVKVIIDNFNFGV